jgi:sugar O-acyltransferase (sialic acid O-acetyltransferase NeuD family)
MKPLVIFGTGDIAELAHFYFSNDSGFKVAGFTVDRPYLRASTFLELPVVPFDEVTTHFPAAEYGMFVAISYAKLNALRKEKYLAAKALGYRIASYLSSKATVCAGFVLGENCFILEDNTIQPFAVVGDNVTLWSGNHIGHHARVADHAFVSSHVVVSGHVQIGESCFIGVNATIRDHVRIGARCVIGAGALVLADVDVEGVLIGQDAKRSAVPSSRLSKI